MEENKNKADKPHKNKQLKKFIVNIKRSWKMILLSIFLAFVLYIALILP